MRLQSGQTGYCDGSCFGTQILPHSATTGRPVSFDFGDAIARHIVREPVGVAIVGTVGLLLGFRTLQHRRPRALVRGGQRRHRIREIRGDPSCDGGCRL